ncbi:MAG: nuclear transport factor 2 family protein [Gammaproteobacteria bacterium]
MKIEELLIREAIRYTMQVYNISGDRGDLAGLASAFCEDGVLNIGKDRVLRGRAEIISGLGSATVEIRRYSFCRHHLSTSRIEIESPTQASGRSYFLVMADNGPDHCGVYIDRFAPFGERWLIVERTVRLDWVASNSLFPPETTRASLRPR